MASIATEKKPLFPPNSSRIHPGAFFPLPKQESFRPDVVVSPSPVSDSSAKLQNGKMLSSSRPTSPKSPKIPLMPPKASIRLHKTNSLELSEIANDVDSNKLGSKNKKAVYSSVPNVSKSFVPPRNVSTAAVLKPAACVSNEREPSLMKEHRQQMPSGNLSFNGPLFPLISPQKYVNIKSTPIARGPPSPPPKPLQSCEPLDDNAVFEQKSPIRRQDSTESYKPNAVCASCKTPKTSPLKLSPSKRAKKPPTPPPKSPSRKASRQNSTSSVGKKSSRHNSSSTVSDDNQQTTPPQSPFKSSPQPVSPSLTKIEVTTKIPTSPKFQSNVETRSSLRLIRIEPTLPTHTSSHQWAARLSLLEDSSTNSFPCSISPGTLRSMELLFSFTDTDILEKLSDSWPVKCTYVVKEVIITERAYVQALTDVIKGYLTPLYSYVLQTGDSPNFITTVFGNIVKIHQIHTNLLESMQSASTQPEDFAQVFIDCDFISQYTLYCTGYSKSNKCLEQTLATECDMKQFIDECQVKLSHTLPLTSYLIKPVQRILKFPLLLEDLYKKFEWMHHPGHKRLKQALDKMSSVATEINTAFNEPVKSSRNCPKAIAQKRLNQIKELQRSRGSPHPPESPRTTHTSPSHSTSFSSVYSRASLFPVPPKKNNSATRVSYLDDKNSFPIRQSSIRTVTKKDDSASVVLKESEASTCSSESVKNPRVKDLKSFYDKLTEQSEEEMVMERRRTGSSIRINTTDSLTESFVEVPRPQVSRANSLGNLFRIGRSSSNKNKDEVEHKSLLRRFGRTKKSKNAK